jgi:GH43 family beta-xylosidase
MKILDYNFTNPRDPYVIFHKGKYYTLISREDALWMKETDSIEEILNAPEHLVYKPEGEYSKSIWAPEIHIVDGTPYIYVTMAPAYGLTQHMFVLTTKSKKVLDTYEKISYLRHTDDAWAIDGTLLKIDSKLYYVYSAFGGYDNAVYQALYIVEMENPYTFKGDIHLLSKSDYDWEKGGCDGSKRPFVNEGPFALYHNNKSYIIYSASGCWTDYYCLGLLTYKGGDPLNKDNWEKLPRPILNNDSGFVGPGHASFIQDEEGGYCFFHAYEKDSSRGEAFVHSHAYRFRWVNDIPEILIKD